MKSFKLFSLQTTVCIIILLLNSWAVAEEDSGPTCDAQLVGAQESCMEHVDIDTHKFQKKGCNILTNSKKYKTCFKKIYKEIRGKDDKKEDRSDCKDQKSKVTEAEKSCREACSKVANCKDNYLNSCREQMVSENPDYSACSDLSKVNFDKAQEDYKDQKEERDELLEEITKLQTEEKQVQTDKDAKMNEAQGQVATLKQQIQTLDVKYESDKQNLTLTSKGDDKKLQDDLLALDSELQQAQLELADQLKELRRAERARRKSCWEKADAEAEQYKQRKLDNLRNTKKRVRISVRNWFKKSGSSVRNILTGYRNKRYSICMGSGMRINDKQDSRDEAAQYERLYKFKVNNITKKLQSKKNELHLRKLSEATQYDNITKTYLLARQGAVIQLTNLQNSITLIERTFHNKTQEKQRQLMNKQMQMQSLATDFRTTEDRYNRKKHYSNGVNLDPDTIGSALSSCDAYSTELESFNNENSCEDNKNSMKDFRDSSK